MLTQDPVRIPDVPGKISFVTIDDKEYVRFLIRRQYSAEKKYTEQDRVLIGRRCETMPGLMYPNENYEKYFGEKEEEIMSGALTPEEEAFTRKNKTLGVYMPFFEALYHEFRQQTRKRPDNRLNLYKAESLNRVLKPLKEIMQGEDYAELLGLAEAGGKDEESGMSHSDVMILLTQYKSALAKYRRGDS